MNVRTRFAPSPTGLLHVGGARTALFCWLFARRHGGAFVLRIEDTDRERSTQASIDGILDGLRWLGLDVDEGPSYQTDRLSLYRERIELLLRRGRAYRCYCSKEALDAMRDAQRSRGEKPRYDGRCRRRSGPPPAGVEPVIRFRNPDEGTVVFDDLVRGTVAFDNRELDDLVIARANGMPTYNFGAVVDDLEMGITHVIRGDDHVMNTPRQLNIIAALNATPPRYAHVPMILGADGQRLAKRHGAVGVMQFRDDGYLPEALLNQLVRLGWSHGDQEIFSREEMIAKFDIADVNRAPAAFDYDKLGWLNQHYIRQADPERLGALLVERIERMGLDPQSAVPPSSLVEIQRDRARTIAEMAEKSRFAFEEYEDFDERAARKHLRPVAPRASGSGSREAPRGCRVGAGAAARGGDRMRASPVAEPREGGPAASCRVDRHRRIPCDRADPAHGRSGCRSLAHRSRHRLGARSRGSILTPHRPLSTLPPLDRMGP